MYTKTKNTLDSSLPIGVFDSGLGGLTVVRAIRNSLPNEDVLYLGDTARVPYGTRSATTVIRYAQSCARALVARGIKALVVACNTVSAVAIEVLRSELNVPILGVIEPGARAAVHASTTQRIGVLGTAGTISSGAYPRAVLALSAKANVFAYAAPLFVPLVEEGWTEGEVPRLTVQTYLAPFKQDSIDTLVLGCTHYPLLRTLIESEAYSTLGTTKVIDSAVATAHELSRIIMEQNLQNLNTHAGHIQLLVTDQPRTFRELTGRFLGTTPSEVEVIDLC